MVQPLDDGRLQEFYRAGACARQPRPSRGTNDSHQGLLMTKLAVNREGDRVIVNSRLEQRKQSRVWLIRGD